MRVKICGVTRCEDVITAAEFGADAIGINLWPQSRRYVERASVSELLAATPPGVEKIAVVVNPRLSEAVELAACGFDALQLHGHETPDFCAELRERGIRFSKAIAATASLVARLREYATDSVILDTSTSTAFGGTGKTFPWELARAAVLEHPDLRIWVAGGLTPFNVADAVRAVRPAGVDVTSGVEGPVREKSRELLKAFIAAARGA